MATFKFVNKIKLSKPNGVSEFSGKFIYNKIKFDFTIDTDLMGQISYSEPEKYNLSGEDEYRSLDEISLKNEDDENFKYIKSREDDILIFCKKIIRKML